MICWVVGDGPWHCPVTLMEPNLAFPRARLAATPGTGVAGETNVVFVDSGGRVNALSASGTQPWTGPTAVGC